MRGSMPARARVCACRRGRVRKQTQIKIVDPETCRELPTGETGEMWVSSDSVAIGYWGKPELTQETFHARIEWDNSNG